jgi:hypothetical protein
MSGPGYKSVREIVQANQLVFQPLDSEEAREEFRQILRGIGDIEVSAPFSIRSALITMHFETPSLYGKVEGMFYDEPLRPADIVREWERCEHFVFWKDLRRSFWTRKPLDPDRYGRWVLLPNEEYEGIKRKLKL